MNLDEMQKAWRLQDAAVGTPIDVDQLLRKVQDDRRRFQRTIFWRDLREVGVAAALVVFFAIGAARNGDWALWLLAGSMLWVGGFMVVDRWLQQRKAAQRPQPPTLIASVEASRGEVDHQIWLLKNILWWYLLPPLVALILFFGRLATHISGAVNHGTLAFLAAFLVPTTICVVLYAGIYWLNQYAVRHNLMPQRDELLAIRDELTRTEE